MKKFTLTFLPFYLFFLSAFIISCGDDDTVNLISNEEPVYTHPLIELSGPGLQEFRDTISLNIENADSLYVEFWSETNLDTTDYMTLNVAMYDTLNGSTYFSNFFTENPLQLNKVHGFGFKMINSTVKLENLLLKGSIDNKFLRIRNFKIYKK